MQVIINGVRYIPVTEVPAAADLCRRISEVFWGIGDAAARDPREWQQVFVDVSDNISGDSVQDFVAFILGGSNE